MGLILLLYCNSSTGSSHKYRSDRGDDILQGALCEKQVDGALLPFKSEQSQGNVRLHSASFISLRAAINVTG